MVKMMAPAPAETWTPLDEGVYRLILKEVEVTTSPNPFAKGHDGEPEERVQFQWKWAVDTGEADMEMPTIKSWTTASVHEKSNTAKILAALGIPLPPPDTEYDTDEWLGSECQGQIAQFPRMDGSTGNKVSGYLAMPKQRGSKAQKDLF